MSKQQFLGEIKWTDKLPRITNPKYQQRLVDFLGSGSKLSGRPAEFLGEIHWLGASKSGLTVDQLKATTTYKTCFSDGVVKCHNKYSDPQQVKDCDDGMVEVCLQLADNEVYAQQQGKETSFNVSALQNAINVRLTQLGICNISADGKLGPTTCAAATYLISKGLGGPGIAVPNACGTIKGTSTFDPNCKLGQAKNTPPPPCTDANCPPGQECWDNKCVDKCPPGAIRGSDGACKSTATASKSSGLGLLVLGAAGVGLAFMASKSQLERIPQHPSRARLQENKHGKRRSRGRH